MQCQSNFEKERLVKLMAARAIIVASEYENTITGLMRPLIRFIRFFGKGALFIHTLQNTDSFSSGCNDFILI